MSSTMRFTIASLIAVTLCSVAARAATQDTLAAAKDLYATAAYQDALQMLEKLKPADPASDDAVETSKYRAFCLFALGRTADAEQVVTDILGSRPRFRLDEREASPRVVTAFRDVRRRQLPVLLEQAYTRGRDAYDQKQTDTAVQQFRLVIDLADDPDTPKDQQLIKEMRVLAQGFLDLAEATKRPPVQPAAPAPATPAQPPPPPPVVRPFYTVDDAGVTPPVAINQQMPAWPLNVPPLRNTTAVLEVLINEKGEVEAAVMRTPTRTIYDAMLLQRAKQWQYRPATFESRPVKYRKMIQITLQAPES